MGWCAPKMTEASPWPDLQEHLRLRELFAKFAEQLCRCHHERIEAQEAERVAKGFDHPEWL